MAHYNRPYGPAERQPPMFYPPQPVEMDPSFPRFSKAWDSSISPLPSGTLEQNMAHNRQLHRSLKPPPRPSLGFASLPSFAPHGGPYSPSSTAHGHTFHSWVSNSDDPWIPKDALVEVSPITWIPKDVSPANPRLQPRSHPLGYPPIGNRNPRSRGFPASVDGSAIPPKTQSDSGYGSIPSMDTSSIRSYEAENRATESRISYYEVDRIPLAGPTALSCPTCHRVVRTRSELKKHDMRHKKPFVCGHLDCLRSSMGFGTKNDLDRHIRSKHPQDRLDGRPGQVHFCVLGACRAKNRKFPRLDNYRYHLKRIHRLGDNEVEDIVRRDKEQQPAPSQGRQLDERVCEDGPDFRAQDDVPDTPLESSHATWSDEPLDTLGRLPELYEVAKYELANTVSPESRGKTPRVESTGELSAVSSPVAGPSPGIEPGPRPDPVDLPSPALDTSGRPTEVGTTIEITSLRRNMAGRKGSPEAGAQKVLATALARTRAVQMLTTALAKARTVQLAKKSIDRIEDLERAEIPYMPFVDPVYDRSSLSRDVPIPQTSDSKNRIAHTQDEDGHEESMDNENATVILQAIQNLGYELKKNSHAAPDSQDSTGKTMIACPKCDKFRGRRCELKKHMKRHDRPYGCTSPGCDKTFGSKNDWKRHENSQHLQYEAWRCTHPADGGECAKVVYHLDSFKAHLLKAHGVAEAQVAAQAAGARRCGVDAPREFWCGFCEGEVEVEVAGEGWTERFNHIDDHFMGRHGRASRSIGEWKQRPGYEVGPVSGVGGRGGDLLVAGESSASSGECASTTSSSSSPFSSSMGIQLFLSAKPYPRSHSRSPAPQDTVAGDDRYTSATLPYFSLAPNSVHSDNPAAASPQMPVAGDSSVSSVTFTSTTLPYFSLASNPIPSDNPAAAPPETPVVGDSSVSSDRYTSTTTTSSSASNPPSANPAPPSPRPPKRGASPEPASPPPPQRAKRRTSSVSGWKRIFCCECECDYNPKTSTECDVDGHRFCGNCVVKRVRVFGGA